MPHPVHFTPRKETRYPLNRRLGGPQSRSGLVRKISSSLPPPVFDHHTVQSVASRYTDLSIVVHCPCVFFNLCLLCLFLVHISRIIFIPCQECDGMHGVCEKLDFVLFIACYLLVSLYVAAYLLRPSAVFTILVSVTGTNTVVYIHTYIHFVS